MTGRTGKVTTVAFGGNPKGRSQPMGGHCKHRASQKPRKEGVVSRTQSAERQEGRAKRPSTGVMSALPLRESSFRGGVRAGGQCGGDEVREGK